MCINWSNQTDQYLAAAGKDKVVSIWNVNTGLNVLQLDKHADAVQAVFFSSDDTKVITIGID